MAGIFCRSLARVAVSGGVRGAATGSLLSRSTLGPHAIGSKRQLSSGVTHGADGDGEMSSFPGARSLFTSKLNIIRTTNGEKYPCYRIMDSDGAILNRDLYPEIPADELIRWYTLMVQTHHMDTILYDAQRQGRISFYMTSYGEEATHIGSAAALDASDIMYAQYREAGVLMYRGMSLLQMMHQCYSNEHDLGKGRQMPVHYGSKEINFHTISSPLGTQIPQAVGAAYTLKNTGSCAICYFGDGAASEGDAHAAMNIAATRECPVIFFVRNNGYAISTPTHEQYRGDGIVSRASGYGLDAIRCDGNDIFAVYTATKAAREIAVSENKPVLIEAMTYRVGHHSTSDDSSAYRKGEEVSMFSTDDPITRMRKHLEILGVWDSEKDSALVASARKEILANFAKAEQADKPTLRHLVTDVYDEVPIELQRQWEQTKKHLEKYGEHYDLSMYAPNKE